ncbi:uncharacterized protein LOC132288848 [Cornus florida]|uniref:uncharacterized protein LOC132288848 n=1 Tax=Cornus florida TaxID=4283 RepID=UPI00289A781B|nr:uncharacterized protein LOC132288848 [Cornus florida]
MGFPAKSSNEGWGTGFLLVFFPEDDAVINKKKNTTTTINTLLRRSNSNHLLSKAQSTISICALLIFITLLLFTLSTFEPTTTTNHFASRKHLSSSNPPILYKTTQKFTHSSPPPWPISLITNHNSRYTPKITSLPSLTSHALQGMGTLYRRGTRAMNDLIVAHVVESVTAHELRLFLRFLHRSGLTSRSDIVFIFSSTSHLSEFDGVIRGENESFTKLIRRYQQMNGTYVNSKASFDVTQFVKLAKKEKEKGEPIWGRRIRSNYSSGEGEGEGELTRLSYGSVVGFEVDELDPEDSLAGFLDHVPMSLRRWACYPMLLGRVRRNFKHTMLVDVKEILLLGDPFGRVRNRSPESVYLSTVSESIPTTPNNKHGRKKSVKTQSHNQNLVNPVIIVGGARGVRRLSNVMLTEIARAAMQQKRKNSMSESGLFQQLVGNGFILKNVNLISSTESIPDASSLTGFSGSLLSLSNHTVVRRCNSNIDLTSVIMKHLCSLELYSSVYCDC